MALQHHVQHPLVLERESARERPRDAIQLVRILADTAKTAENRPRIGDVEADAGMKKYSRERVKDVSDEFAKDCDSISKIIESFAEINFESSFEALRVHLKTIGSRFKLIIRGETIKPEDDDDAIRLLRFLHEIGFINARVNDSRMPRGFRHINFQDDPDFVNRANWNNLQACTWEIHPAFRSFLMNAKLDMSARR